VETIKIITWNMAHNVANWQTVLASNIDVALLQEALMPPNQLRDEFIICEEDEGVKSGHTWRTMVVGLQGSKIIDFVPIKTQPLGGNDPSALMVSRPGSLSAAGIRIRKTGEEITVVSMYANWMNPISQTGSSWIFADASTHRLISDLSGLIGQQKRHKIIAAGDLNILYGYGEGGSSYWKGRYDTVFDRMAALGLKFVGPQAPEGGRQADPWPKELPEESLNVPTFHTNQQTPVTATRQLDFVFASESIADRVAVRALNSLEEWGPSDHCRVMLELFEH
jgi:hypothetical protein